VFGNGNVLANTTASGFPAPLPTNWSGTSVSINGVPCPMSYVSPAQVNVQVPEQLTPGIATVVVNNNGVTYTTSVSLVAASPGIFTSDFLVTAILQDQNGALLTQSNPANPGQEVVMYATGIGPVNPSIATNQIAGVPLSQATSSYGLTVDGTPAQVAFLGFVPGFIGLGQVNFIIPSSTPASNAIPVVLTINGVSSKTVQISVR
jgi:uncharacterized protein (TIGR03437 family)